MSAAGLQGLCVLVTRPADQSEALCRLLEAQGAQVARLPLQAIESARQPAVAARALQAGRDADAWIFTSANAVRFARQLDAGVWPQCIAVGPATAAALVQIGVAVERPEEVHTSEGVLALPALQEVRNRTVLLVTGENGRDAIESGLQARGARVLRVEVYRRVALPHTGDAVAQALHGVHAVIVTSGEALRRLVDLMPGAAGVDLMRLRLVVPSRRVLEQALELGFTTAPLVPGQITDAGYVHCLLQWHSGG